MEQPWLWVALSAGELLLVLLLLLLVSWFRNRAAARRDRRAIRALVEGAKKAKDQRREDISGFLSDRFGMAGEELLQAVRGVYQAELRLIQTFANIYLQRNAVAAANFRREVEGSVEPYWSLSAEGYVVTDSEAVPDEELAAEQDAADSDEDMALDDAELARLRGENTRLSEELRVTMDTMSRMLNEYSSIFSKDAEVSDITVLDAEGPSTQAEAGDEGGVASTGEQAAAADAAVDPQPVAEPEAAADAVPDDADLDPDAVLASVEAAEGPAAQSTVADRGAPLDPAMRDLSLDDEDAPDDVATPDEQEQAAERQRVIDAES